MPDLKLFNPAAALVVAKKPGLRINGKTYAFGEALKDSTVGKRKRMQLFAHNKLTHPELMDELPLETQKQEEPAPAGSTSEPEQPEAPAPEGIDRGGLEEDSPEEIDRGGEPRSKKKRSKKKASRRSSSDDAS